MDDQKTSQEYLYIIALGSNRRHHKHGRPRDIIFSALEAIEQKHISVYDHSNIIETPAIGPSLRNFANSAAIILSPLSPDALLLQLQVIERDFGDRRGQKWSARCLDIDIILWSGGIWSSANPALSIPHPLYHKRDFVLQPAAQIAGNWIDPIRNIQINHILFRNSAPKRVDRLVKSL